MKRIPKLKSASSDDFVRPDLGKFWEGMLDGALESMKVMEQPGVSITRNNAYRLLQECEKTKDLECGKRIQSLMIQSGLDSITVLSDHLIRLFTYHGDLLEANQVFHKTKKPGLHTWAAIIFANAKLGQSEVAISLYHEMQLVEIRTRQLIYVTILRACTTIAATHEGRIIHAQILLNELQPEIVLWNAVIDMYAKCGSLDEASKVLQDMPLRDVVSWNTMIAGYAKQGQNISAEECLQQMQKEDIEPNVMSWGALIGGYAQQGEGLLALECFKKMEQEGIQPNDVIFLSALKACAAIEQVDQGKLIHDKILKGGFQSNVVLGSTLIDMYAKCGSLEEAYKVFDNLQGRDIVSWNAMITGYAQCGEGFLALEYFHEMLKERIEPSQVTFLGILKACAILRATECGRLIHDRIIKSKLQSDVVVGSTLVDMYAKCGSLQEACSVFHKLPNRNVVSWGAMIAGYSQWEEGFLALDTFQKMQLEGIRANDVVFLGTLQACACIGNIEQARFMHHEVIVSGLQSDIVVGNTLVDMYAKCGSLEEAQSAFKNLPYRDVVSWGAIIAGYAQHGECFVALQWFERMQEDGILPDEVTFLSLLKACAIVGAIEKGKFIHDEIIKRGLHFDVVVGNTLVDMYAKCGSLEEACKVFNKLQDRDLVSWNAMVSGYSHYGKGLLALECFENMLKEGIVPNDVSFHVILVTCSYSGLVDEGHWYFNLMRKYQGLRPGISHCTSMIDLLGRAGCLYEAEYFLHSTKQADVTCWTSLLSACKLHQNLELGQHCFDRMISLDTDCSAGYVLISNIYADVHMHWETCDVEILGSWESESLKAAL